MINYQIFAVYIFLLFVLIVSINIIYNDNNIEIQQKLPKENKCTVIKTKDAYIVNIPSDITDCDLCQPIEGEPGLTVGHFVMAKYLQESVVGCDCKKVNNN